MTEGPQAVRYGSAPLVFGDDERNSWIRRSLEELPAGSQILDVGAGPMRYRDLCRHLSYVSHDFCQYDGRGDGVGYQNQDWDTSRIDIVSDISTIPVADSSFDAVLCISVLEHVPDPISAIREMARIIRPRGKIIVTAPFANITHQAPFHFYTGFPRYFYEKHLSEWFEIDNIAANGNMFSFINTLLHYILTFRKRYTRAEFTAEEEKALDIVTGGLIHLAENDVNSGDVINFGYQVNATRR